MDWSVVWSGCAQTDCNSQNARWRAGRTALAQTKRSRRIWVSFEWQQTEHRRMFICFRNIEMATKLSLSGHSDPDSSSLNDQSLSSRSINRSLRVAEKERRKNEAEDPLVLALKYFSDGRSALRRTHGVVYWCTPTMLASRAYHTLVNSVSTKYAM